MAPKFNDAELGFSAVNQVSLGVTNPAHLKDLEGVRHNLVAMNYINHSVGKSGPSLA